MTFFGIVTDNLGVASVTIARQKPFFRSEIKEQQLSWMNVLQALGVALVGLIGVALGAWINQRGARTLARQTLEGQRVLARDADLRDRRKQQVDPYYEAATNRTRIWLEMHDATSNNDEKRLLALSEELLDPHFNNLVVTYLAIPDDAFRTAFQKFIDGEGQLKGSYTKEEIVDVVKKMRLALIELNEAMEHYILLR
jgi:hypothetical protein